MEAVSRWKSAQLGLQNAAQSFLDASTSLRAAVTRDFVTQRCSPSLEALICMIQSELAVNDSIESTLAQARMIVRGTRNMSNKQVPINFLPLEILGHIFALATASDFHSPCDTKTEPVKVISLVCRHWRELAIRTGALWSHIDLFASSEGANPLDTARLWRERAHGVPLQLHIRDYSALHTSRMQRWFGAPHPRLTPISSIEMDNPGPLVINDCLALVPQVCTPDVLKTLIVTGRGTSVGRRVWPSRWPTEHLRGLVNLWLSELSRHSGPSLGDLLTILASSESLQTLRLGALDFLPFLDTNVPIRLPNLTLLDVAKLRPELISVLLPNLMPGKAELELRTSINRFNALPTTNVLTSFCDRSHVVALYLACNATILNDDMLLFFSSIPALRVLVFDDSFDKLCALESLVKVAKKQTQDARWKLHTLGIVNDRPLSLMPLYSLAEVLDFYKLCKLVLDGCGFGFLSDGGQEDWESDSDDDAPQYAEKTEESKVSLRAEIYKRVETLRAVDYVLRGETKKVDWYMRGLIQDSACI